MRKTNILWLLTLLLLLHACGDDSGETDYYALPENFPLEVGNAWQYERTFYNQDGSVYSTVLDTLEIPGMYEDYYLYDWASINSSALVKHEGQMLLEYGTVQSEPIIFPDPGIMYIYNTTGDLETPIEGYLIGGVDSVNISTTTVNFEGEDYKSYVLTINYNQNSDQDYSHRETIYNRVGFYSETTYYIDGTKAIEIQLLKGLE